MTISRAQIPEQIDVFQEGGGAESDSVDTGLSDLEKEIQFLFDFNFRYSWCSNWKNSYIYLFVIWKNL